MDQPVDERRLDARYAAGYSAIRATLRPGCLVMLVDVSAGGALVEAARPLRPGARVHLQLVNGHRTVALAAHVLRCAVWSLGANGVTYRGALKFDDRCCDWPWDGGSREGSGVPEAAG